MVLTCNSFILQLIFMIPALLGSFFFGFGSGSPELALVGPILSIIVTIFDLVTWYSSRFAAQLIQDIGFRLGDSDLCSFM